MKLLEQYPEMIEPMTTIPPQSRHNYHHDDLINNMRGKLQAKLSEVYGSTYDWRTISLGWQQALVRLGFVPSLNRWNNPIEPADKDAAASRLIERLTESHYLEFADSYGEPGYTDPEKGILFANWNDVPKSAQEFLESQGYELEWSDEWYVHYDSSPTKAYRTSPDSYQWTSQIKYCDDGYVLTPECDISDWIDECKCEGKNDTYSCLPDWVKPDDLKEYGYFDSEEKLEASMHYPTDSPTDIVAKLQEEFKSNFDSVLFQITCAEQFASHYRVFIRSNDWEGCE